ncbi:hypothetical protein GQX74_010487 [Glossina fuscipes]|nr:hypothetical protein GQX74_010487 [Glossina fuscipes]
MVIRKRKKTGKQLSIENSAFVVFPKPLNTKAKINFQPRDYTAGGDSHNAYHLKIFNPKNEITYDSLAEHNEASLILHFLTLVSCLTFSCFIVANPIQSIVFNIS